MSKDLFPGGREEQVALNCPKVGDIWSEMMANQIYVCSIDEEGVRVLFLWGGGRKAYLFDNVGEFQDWIMYSTAPVKGNLEGWTWCNFMDYDIGHSTWMKSWVEQARETGAEKP